MFKHLLGILVTSRRCTLLVSILVVCNYMSLQERYGISHFPLINTCVPQFYEESFVNKELQMLLQ